MNSGSSYFLSDNFLRKIYPNIASATKTGIINNNDIFSKFCTIEIFVVDCFLVNHFVIDHFVMNHEYVLYFRIFGSSNLKLSNMLPVSLVGCGIAIGSVN